MLRATNPERCRFRRMRGHAAASAADLCCAVQNPVVQAEQRQLKAIGHAQLVIHFAQIIFDHLFGGAYAQGDFLVLHALGYAGNDERFFRSQLHLGPLRSGTCAWLR